MRFVLRRFAAFAGVTLLASFSASASAQTAPTLLPSTVKLVAGGGSATTASGGTCPVSGLKASDAYGDGCLATEIRIGNVAAPTADANKTPGARAAVADAAGNIFFTDFVNNLVRRIDATTGVVTAVAGGASSSPASGTACGTGISVDGHGDGCLSTLVKLTGPVGLAFAPNGDLYFTETGQSDVRKIAATNALIPATGGIISNIAGTTTGTTYGYTVSNSTTTIIAASQSYLDAPVALAFDNKGDLFIAEQFKNAVLAVNLNTTGNTTVNGVTMAPGTIWKVAGAYGGTTAVPTVSSDCPNGTSGTFGCTFNPYVDGAQANLSSLDNPYGLAVDSTGNVYFSDEYYYSVPVVSTAGVITTYAGTNGTGGKGGNGTRATAGSFAIGSPYGLAMDTAGDLYIGDAAAGIVWRVDASSKSMYAVAGGATTVCGSATDTNGDGCPGLQAKFYASSSNSSSNTLPGPGLYSLSIDPFSNLYVADTENNVVRTIASGAYFGQIGTAATTSNVIVHFAKGDSPASSAYSIASGTIFTLGTANCVTNSDTTMDCTLPVTAKPTALGAFSGSIKVTSTLGASATFPLGGVAIASKVTTTSITSNLTSCSTSTAYSNAQTITLTATVTAYTTPSAQVQFLNNGVAFGSPVTLSSAGVATLTQTFPTGNYVITAKYLGDANTNASTSATAITFTTATSTFGLNAVNSGAQSTVTAGQTALYTFSVNSSAYVGTLSFFCSGLPAGASCVFNPAKISITACDTSTTSALSILTSANPVTLGSSKTAYAGLALGTVFFALAIGMRRRKLMAGLSTAALLTVTLLLSSGLTACSSKISDKSIPTPKGTYTVTVTIAGSPTASAATGASQTFTVPLTIQ